MPEWHSIKTTTQWGDYWSVLIGGMTAHLPRYGDQLQLERTGPFVPSMVVSGMEDLIVNETMRRALESVAGVMGFRPVIKARIVRLDWSAWKRSGGARELYQFSEPEDAVLSLDHDPALADGIGELYEVLLQSDGKVRLGYDADGLPTNSFSQPPARHFDLFKATTRGGYGFVIDSAQFVSQLPEELTRWLEFNPVTISETTTDDDEDWT